jgi:uncharacterized membrane protein YukC
MPAKDVMVKGQEGAQAVATPPPLKVKLSIGKPPTSAAPTKSHDSKKEKKEKKAKKEKKEKKDKDKDKKGKSKTVRKGDIGRRQLRVFVVLLTITALAVL